mgnify:CR=1 FL=1|jgi:hypothetical protein|tara:strand:- start:1521 stop:2390 length:870 start_codon:yes stop_codon:yes gene_type:complete
MKKPINQVFLLLTENVADIIVPTRGVGKGVPHLKEYYGSAQLEMGDEYYYLYVTEGVKPIKGDWVMNTNKDAVYQYTGHGSSGNRDKVIATDDPKLTKSSNWVEADVQGHWECTNCGGWTELTEDRTCKCKPVSKLQQSFIKEYAANPDGEWEVEYNTNNIHNQEVMFHEEHKEKFFEDRINGVWKSYIPLQTTLKLNQNNEVNITSVNKCLYDTPKSCENSECRVLNKCNGDRVTSVEEKMYTLEQMYLSAANVVDQIAANRGNSDWTMKVTPKMIVDNWLTKESLKP